MAYNPINIEAYTAAFAGAIAGMSTGGWITNPSPASYSALTNIAGAYAQAFDTAWNSAAPLNALEQAAITDAIASEFGGRTPTLSNLALQQASNWTINANACVAAVLQSDAYFAANGIIPPVSPISPVGPNQYSTITAWFVDPVNGSDTNTGTSSNTPLKTKAEIARRLGSWTPTISGIAVTVTMLNPDTNGNDPWLFIPVLINGASLILTATLPAPSFTGTLLAVTAKNRGTNTPLESTFTTVTGAIAAGMMLVNATRGNSVAFAFRNLGAGNWVITQPVAPQTVPLASPNAVTSVDTWANGDAITGFVLPTVNVGRLGCYEHELSDSLTNGAYLYRVNVGDFSNTTFNGIMPIVGLGGTAAVESSFQSYVTGGWNNLAFYPMFNWVNSFCNNGLSFTGAKVFAGSVGNFTASFFLCQITNDYVLGNSGGTLRDTQCGTGGVYFDNNPTVTVQGRSSIVASGTSAFYGSGTLNATTGATLQYSGATAVNSFNGLTLQLAGKTTGYSASTAGGVGSGGVTTWHNLNLTPAALDAATGATGFGGYALGASCTITNAGAQA